MGLALGKTIHEIKAIPYPEFKSWQFYYLLEPFGFEDREYRTASILSKLHNTNVSKKKDLKKPGYFIRDMPKEILKVIRRKILQQDSPTYDLNTDAGRKAATEEIMKNFYATGLMKK